MRRKKIILTGLMSILALIVLPIAGVSSFILVKCPKQEITIPIEDHTVDIDGLTIYYRTAGNPEKQPIIFLHGWGARKDGRCGIDGVIAALAEHFYVIAPEHPGLNRSDPPGNLWSYDEYADALELLLEPLQLMKPVIMGQSFGGGIATAYAVKYPDNVGGVILVDSVTTLRPYSWFMRAKHAWDSLSVSLLQSRLTPSPIKRSITSLWLGTPLDLLDDEELQKRTIMWAIDRYKDLERPLNIDYQRIPLPFVLVWGDKDTWTTPIQRARKIHEEVEGSILIVVPGTHTVLYQRPKEMIDLIVQSLSSS